MKRRAAPARPLQRRRLVVQQPEQWHRERGSPVPMKPRPDGASPAAVGGLADVLVAVLLLAMLAEMVR